jgi:hypothetical protein
MLRANRTRNAGSGQAAGAAANRGASEDLSQINAGIQTGNANLKNQQQKEGLAGESGLLTGGENALGLSDTALHDAGTLPNEWQTILNQYLGSGEKAAASLAGG